MRGKIKRVYESRMRTNGFRILVDHRCSGFNKRARQSTCGYEILHQAAELRNWFIHDPAKWEEFQHR
jgi:uncharacterized protein YeaO (DUF488 family)